MDAEVFRAWIVSAAGVIEANRDRLTQLDAAIGDADHGINLTRGFTAVLGALGTSVPTTPGAILTVTGTTLITVTVVVQISSRTPGSPRGRRRPGCCRRG
jgi:phosphoenolpyruvate---glycerone phosphotransferase subunit DhaL